MLEITEENWIRLSSSLLNKPESKLEMWDFDLNENYLP